MLQIKHWGGVAKPGQPRRTQDYTIQMGDPVPKGFVGSNPTPSIISSARVTEIKYPKEQEIEASLVHGAIIFRWGHCYPGSKPTKNSTMDFFSQGP